MNRCRNQSKESLETFYSSTFGENGESPSILGNAMLKLISAIDEGIKYKIWGLTSLMDLILLPCDDSTSPWKVRLLAIDEDEIRIEYLLPEGAAPWDNAYASITAASIHDAIDILKTCILHSKIYEKFS